MRQKKVLRVTIGAVVVLVIVLVGFGLLKHSHAPTTGTPAKPALSGMLKEGVRVVKMTARQFEFVPGTVVVRQNEKVRLEITSEDVQHGIMIEEYDIKRILNPGKPEEITFTASEPGRYHFHCSVYCGEGHSEMHGELVILSE